MYHTHPGRKTRKVAGSVHDRQGGVRDGLREGKCEPRHVGAGLVLDRLVAERDGGGRPHVHAEGAQPLLLAEREVRGIRALLVGAVGDHRHLERRRFRERGRVRDRDRGVDAVKGHRAHERAERRHGIGGRQVDDDLVPVVREARPDDLRGGGRPRFLKSSADDRHGMPVGVEDLREIAVLRERLRPVDLGSGIAAHLVAVQHDHVGADVVVVVELSVVPALDGDGEAHRPRGPLAARDEHLPFREPVARRQHVEAGPGAGGR